MNFYCENCHSVFPESSTCPLCRKRNVRLPQNDDLCFLCEVRGLMATVVEDVLQQEGLRFIKRPVYGAGISAVTGQFLDSMRFYTVYSEYEKGRELVDAMFDSESE